MYKSEDLANFAGVLLNLRHCKQGNLGLYTKALFAKLKQESAFKFKFLQNDIFLFTRVLSN